MSEFSILPAEFYARRADVVAPDLLGRYLRRQVEGQELLLRIVETEAYLGAEDRASHAWGGRRTARNASLYKEGGCAYVYFIYGMWHCLNAVTGRPGEADAVLIRAAEVLAGHESIGARRGLGREPRPGDLAGGPGKLCQGLAIDKSLDGESLQGDRLSISFGKPLTAAAISVGPRVGVDYAGEAASWPLRFATAGCAEVSRPYPW